MRRLERRHTRRVGSGQGVELGRLELFVHGVEGERRYQFRVAAQNPGGVSDHVYSGYIYTTPAAPVAVNAVKLSEQSVRVTVDASKSYVYGIRLRRRVNGGEWADITGGTPGATAEGWLPDINGIQNVTWTDTAAPAGQVQYAALVGRPVYGDDNSKTTLSPTGRTATLSRRPWPLPRRRF